MTFVSQYADSEPEPGKHDCMHLRTPFSVRLVTAALSGTLRK